jgi:hypothetical protein
MQRLEVSCAVRPIYGSLGTKGLKVGLSNSLCEIWNRYGCIPFEDTGECITTDGRNCHMHLDVSPVDAQDYAYFLQKNLLGYCLNCCTAVCCMLSSVVNVQCLRAFFNIICYKVQKQGSLAGGKLWVSFWYSACAFYILLISRLIHNTL